MDSTSNPKSNPGGGSGGLAWIPLDAFDNLTTDPLGHIGQCFNAAFQSTLIFFCIGAEFPRQLSNVRKLNRQFLDSPNLVHTAAKLSTLSIATGGFSFGPSGSPTIRLMIAATRIMHSQSKAWFSLRLRAHL